MSILTRPQGRIPIGHVVIGGQRLAVELDLEWDRYFQVLTERAGGVVGPSNIVTYISQTVAPSVVLDGGGGDDVEFIPGPQGLRGEQGPPGPAIFIMEDPAENDVFWRV
jgi:hypothetical protein